MDSEEEIKIVIDVFYKVYKKLRNGFLEKVYENAMAVEFAKIGLDFRKQCPIKVYYDGEIVGDYVADFLVGDDIVIEVKAIREFSGVEKAQLLNYLKATKRKKGILLNFGVKPQVKRMVF
ncbi:MAG: GxxExxY protein [archaeon]